MDPVRHERSEQGIATGTLRAYVARGVIVIIAVVVLVIVARRNK